MGGLISRYYIESTPGLNRGDKVRKLVMVGTPNEGTAVTHVDLEDTPSLDTILAAQALAGIYGVTGETNIDLTTVSQLLPDYPYYRENQGAVTTNWVPATGYGYPTDLSMDLLTGSSGRLGPNTFLAPLNADGLDARVENFIVYRHNLETVTTMTRTENPVFWTIDEEPGPGDGTVPVRSAIMSDYPSASAQLQKCVMEGTKHAEMMLDSLVQDQVRATLSADVEESVPFCTVFPPSPTPRTDMRDPLIDFIEKSQAMFE